MLTITHRPEALAIREQIGPTGDHEIVIFGVDTETGTVVEIAMDPESAREFGQKLAAPRVDVASAGDLEQLRRNGGH
jgi:hypothetical protein